jgi:Domain of unknown function (DUF4123)
MRPTLETVAELPTDSRANVSETAQAPAGSLTQLNEGAVLGGLQKRLLDILRSQPQRLFALLDSARTDRVLNLLRNSAERCESLYQGKLAEDTADYAPYLVQLQDNSSLLASLVSEGWGRAWGVYLTCQQSFEELRKHFRHFLLVQTEDGQELYFRFYDPRVLRVFLPTCTPEETTQFFGPIASYLLESDDAQALLRFCSNPAGVSEESILLTD